MVLRIVPMEELFSRRVCLFDYWTEALSIIVDDEDFPKFLIIISEENFVTD